MFYSKVSPRIQKTNDTWSVKYKKIRLRRLNSANIVRCQLFASFLEEAALNEKKWANQRKKRGQILCEQRRGYLWLVIPVMEVEGIDPKIQEQQGVIDTGHCY